jgi:hypothetical protein
MTKEDWIIEGHTGVSSKAIWSHFTFGKVNGSFATNPSDPSDFLRCYWLLKLAPDWRSRIGEMAQYKGWEKIAPAWDELERMVESVWPCSCKAGGYEYIEPPAKAMYARMQELRRTL